MTPPLGYSRDDGDIVTLRMTHKDHQILLICLGYAAAGEPGYVALALANRLQEGVPAEQWTPYFIPEDAPS